MAQATFQPALFTFLRQLKKNNDREWFKANKPRYERDIKEPALAFIEQFEKPLRKISRHFRADPRANGGSLFRIHRDTRFSKDKTPYKTHVGIHFRHAQAKDVHAPGFYLHLEPGGCFVGAGIWHPEPKVAQQIRGAIDESGAAWKKVAYGRPFATRYKLAGDSLKRPPRGFDPEHPHLDDLKRKDFIAVADLKQSDVTSGTFFTKYAKLTTDSAAFMKFLCKAVDVPF